MQTNVKVLGGIEITVEFNEFELGADEWVITHISNTPIRPNYRPQWLYDRIRKAGEIDLVSEACENAVFESKYIQ